MNIILGSGSPRRKSILEGIFGNIQVIIPSVDESNNSGESVYSYVERVSNLKMDSVLSKISLQNETCVITSDTIVSIDDEILGKPVSEEHAVSMLRTLSGREHNVITGISIVVKNSGETERFYSCEKTSVMFKLYNDDIIRSYLSRINYTDKAGSYAIQDNGEMLVRSISGSVTNVIGFPLSLFFRMIGGCSASEFFFK